MLVSCNMNKCGKWSTAAGVGPLFHYVNSGNQTQLQVWWQSLLPTEPACWPFCVVHLHVWFGVWFY